jgi:hypothetical protein
MKETFKHVLAELSKIRSCNFVSLLYRTKGTGELSKYQILLNVSLTKAYRRDEKIISSIKPSSFLEEQAQSEILESLRESLKVGIGNNSQYTCKGIFQHLFNGCQYHPELETLYIYGFLSSKSIIEPGNYKVVNSKPLTVIKNEMRKKMKISRFRKFELNNIKKISFNHNILSLE